jgi:alpha,alpha-trehalase
VSRYSAITVNTRSSSHTPKSTAALTSAAGVFLSVLLLGLAINCAPKPSEQFRKGITVDVNKTLSALIEDEDTDGDKRITVDDPHIIGTRRGDKQFWFESTNGGRYEVVGTYYLSNLLQELKLAEESGKDSSSLDPGTIFEPPSERISRMIREVNWDGLTRRIDSTRILDILADEKTSTVDGYHYLYVPSSDTDAYHYYTNLVEHHPANKIKVVELPPLVTPQYVRSLDGRHGLLVLKLARQASGGYAGVPYVVPGGRFNEMYGWDSYFIVLGLLSDGRIGLAKDIVDNFVYEIQHYGKILNANRTYYLTRSQPPFLTSMMLSVYGDMEKNETTKAWLAGVLDAAIREYRNVWMNSDHRTDIGLSRYFDTGSGPCPEVEPGHYDAVFALYAEKFKMKARNFEQAYRTGRIKVPELDRYFVNDRAMRESGHDTSYRLEGRCADLATVDLNSLLYKIETDIAETIRNEFSGKLTTPGGTTEESAAWFERAEHRKELMNEYLWNEQRGMFFDYDVVQHSQVEYVSATTFYPLWAGWATQEQADALVRTALPQLEMPGGIAASSEASRGPLSAERQQRQWDYPYGWAPHQMLVWRGLQNYGFNDIARRLVYRWLFTMTENAVNYNGTITEKLDVVNRSHDVFAEYGNVGTRFAYITREGFGWSNASYQVGLNLLSPRLRTQLDALVPPEWISIR